jgi:hypothetical protein
MNSETGADADKIIHEIAEKTSEEFLYRYIDKDFENKVASFQYDQSAPVTHDRFLKTIEDFLNHIYSWTPAVEKTLAASQAQAEALYILEHGYQNSNSKGYYAAYLDALNPNYDGLRIVLEQMAEYIKTRARSRYLRWVYATCIDSLDWSTRCFVAECLLKRWRSFLPPSFSQVDPSQLADHLPEMINMLLSVDKIVKGLLKKNAEDLEP